MKNATGTTATRSILRWGAIVAIAAMALLVLLLAATDRTEAGHLASTIDNVSIDMDHTGNTATSIGTIQTCARINNNGILDADEEEIDKVYVDVVTGPAGVPVDQPLNAFEYTVDYNNAAVQVTAKNHDFLLGAAGGPSYFDASDGLPNSDGSYYIGVLDFSTNYESGPGVLTRLTIEGIGSGMSALTFDAFPGVRLYDSASLPVTVSNVNLARVVVDQPCAVGNPVVDTTSDAFLANCTGAAGDCSLRGAISASGDPAVNTITFDPAVFPPNLPSVTPSIALTSPLPFMTGTEADVINGANTNVIVDGQTDSFPCFSISGSNKTITRIDVIRHCSIGVDITGSNNTIGGTNAAEGTCGAAVDNDSDGYTNDGCAQNTGVAETGAKCTEVPGSVVDDDLDTFFNDGCPPRGEGIIIHSNFAAGVTGIGIKISGESADANTVKGNYIGTDRAGTFSLGNDYGLWISGGADDNIIGISVSNPPDRNMISGNLRAGVRIEGSGTTGNVLRDNHIGVDAVGNTAIANGTSGVEIYGGASGNYVQRAVISGNSFYGVVLTDSGTTGNVIRGNYIGLGRDGVTDVGNTLTGVYVDLLASGTIVGGTSFGNVIGGNGGHGVFLYSTGNTVNANYIGTDYTATSGVGNDLSGVSIASSGNTVGGTTATERNVISGNNINGVEIAGAGASGNVVRGNHIGTNAAGTGAIANSSGVVVSGGATGNTIGGTTAGDSNVISGNTGTGVQIDGSGTNGNTVSGNYIGSNAADSVALANGGGITITGGAQSNTIGGTMASARNVISGNNNDGIVISDVDTKFNVVSANFIGTNTAGGAAVANIGGIAIQAGAQDNTVGGATAGARNVISGNTFQGIAITSNLNTVKGNYIGTNAAGTAALANGLNGVLITSGATGNTIGGTTATDRNVISGNSPGINAGVAIEGGATGNFVRGNYIGTNASGTSPIGNGVGVYLTAPGNTIGGLAATTGTPPGNVMSGNSAGILIKFDSADSNVVQGNLIGTNAAGTGPVPNTDTGVYFSLGPDGNTIGGSAAGARNVISGNGLKGINLFDSGTTGNVVQGNYIGTDITGTSDIGNIIGIHIGVGNIGSTIGGTGAGQGNVIAFNSQSGVCVDDGGPSTGNSIRGNSIHSNTLLGIDLVSGVGTCATGTVTLNDDASDADSGPNNLMNFPVITSASYNGVTNQTTISGTLATPSPDQTRVDVYASAAKDPSGYGEGQVYLGTATPSGAGAWSLTISGVLPQPYLSATATDTNGTGSTSEFSAVPDTDADGDGVPNSFGDNCPLVDNPFQMDTDADGVGDVCDAVVRNRHIAIRATTPTYAYNGLEAWLTTAPGQPFPAANQSYAAWDYQPGGGIDIGAIVGEMGFAFDVGFGNGPCVNSAYFQIAGLNASLDNSAGNLINTSDLLLDVNPANGIPDGADRYPRFLNTILDPDRRTNINDDGDGLTDEDPAGGGDNDGDTKVDEDGAGTPAVPHARYFGVYGASSFIQVLVFEETPNLLYRVVTIAGDPTAGPSHLPTETSCAPLEFRSGTYDLTLDNPATGANEAGDAVINTPPAATRIRRVETIDAPDADGDSLSNADDNCHLVVNVSQADTDADGIGNACDPTMSTDTNAGDHDLDGFKNASDNCPTIANGSQAESEKRTPGPFGQTLNLDGIGDACDPSPTFVSDAGPLAINHYSSPICVGLTDVDGDGWCSADDAADDNAAKTPESDLVAPGSCSNGIDDDGDFDVDSADPSCVDFDGDRVPNSIDNCDEAANPLQLDSDLPPDGVGDACEAQNLASMQVVEPTGSANSELRSRLVEVAPKPLHKRDGILTLTDADWLIASDGAVTNGAIRAALTSLVTAAVDPDPVCNKTLTFNFTLLDASTNTADTIGPSDPPGAPFSYLISDTNVNSLPDGVDKFPLFLTRMAQTSSRINDDSGSGDVGIDEDPTDSVDNDNDGLVDEDPFNPITPLARLFGSVSFQGATHVMNVLIYNKGTLPPFAVADGYPALFVIDDPFTAQQNGSVTAFCSSEDRRLFQYGVSLDNPATGAVEAPTKLLTNAATLGTQVFLTSVAQQPDLDGDGIENSLDACTFEPDNDFDGTDDQSDPSPWNPRLVAPPGDFDLPFIDGLPVGCDRPEDYPPAAGECANASDDDFDGKVNDGCPAVGAPETGFQCDNNTDNDFDGKVNDGCPTSGDPLVPSPPGSGPDEDLDHIPNSGDNCRYNPNFDQRDSDGDGVGDVCDTNPTVFSGGGATQTTGSPTCPAGSTDQDKDGFCSDIDAYPSSDNPNDNGFNRRPENSSYSPDLCSDGLDNEPDGPPTGPSPVLLKDTLPPNNDPDCADVDGDGVLNAQDNCPGYPPPANPLLSQNANQADADGDSGSHFNQQPFLRSDAGVAEGEPVFSGQPFLRSDRWGGDLCDPDDDNDGLGDGDEPTVQCRTRADCDGDFLGDLVEWTYSTCLNPTVPDTYLGNHDVTLDPPGDTLFTYGEGLIGTNPCARDASLDLDPDLDGFKTGVERYVGTDPAVKCNNGLGLPDWPVDFDNSQLVDISDVLVLKPIFNVGLTATGFPRRQDLIADALIDISDVLVLKPVFNASC